MKSKWIEYKGKRIYYADYTDFGDDIKGLKAEVEYAHGVVMQEPDKSVLLLVDVSRTTGTTEALNSMKNAASVSETKVIRTAVLGVHGFKKMLMQTIAKVSGMNIVAFEDTESAKDWLVKED
jgi:hypothetical protein